MRFTGGGRATLRGRRLGRFVERLLKRRPPGCFGSTSAPGPGSTQSSFSSTEEPFMSAITNAVPNTEGRVVPWNKGKLLGQKPPLKLKEIWAIQIRLQLGHRTREVALFNLAIDSKLRGCDLVGLRVHDVAQGSRVAPRAIVMQKKTQRPVQLKSLSKRGTRSPTGSPRRL